MHACRVVAPWHRSPPPPPAASMDPRPTRPPLDEAPEWCYEWRQVANRGAIANRIGPLRRRHRLRRRRRRRWIRGRRGRRRTMRLNGATNGVRSPTMDTLCNKFIDDYHLVEAAAGRCA